jgi:hypothetical protein
VAEKLNFGKAGFLSVFFNKAETVHLLDSTACSCTMEPVHCKKKVSEEFLNYSRQESLVSDIPAGNGKTANLFLQCTILGKCRRFQ